MAGRVGHRVAAVGCGPVAEAECELGDVAVRRDVREGGLARGGAEAQDAVGRVPKIGASLGSLT